MSLPLSLLTKKDDTPQSPYSPRCTCPCHRRAADKNIRRGSNTPTPTPTTAPNTFSQGDENPSATTFNSPCHSSGDVRLSQPSETTPHHPTGDPLFTLEPLFEQVVVRFSLGEANVDGGTNGNDGGGRNDGRRPTTSRQAHDRRSSTDGRSPLRSGPSPSTVTTREAATSTAAGTSSTLASRTRTGPSSSSRRVNRRSDPYKGPAQRRASRSETKTDY
ncbi:hypothetical protein FRB91_010288 [Serendipita sp. 411]|nr:hypothetical protein FRC18_003326 [Serendipita sp. 400]KAG8858138.1 hypothetical protein FRB91_010288 [Serendipita sp. 411]